MQLQLKDTSITLRSSMIMGIIDISHKNPLSLDEIVEIADEYKDSGAAFIELSVDKYTEHSCSEFEETDILCGALEALKDCELIVGVYTSRPEVMRKAADCGAQFVVDPDALRQPGAIEVIAQTGMAAGLLYDQKCCFSENDDDVDPCAVVSEFFYERLDACMNAHIDRQKIFIDPMIGINTSVDYRLKLFGRLKTFNSFGLPLSCSLPRMVTDDGYANEQSMSIVTAVALFAEQQGMRIIRTHKVYDIALAINSWHALHQSARPFKLSRAIGEKLKNLANRRRQQ